MKTYQSIPQTDIVPLHDDENRSVGSVRDDEPAWDVKVADEKLPAFPYRRIVE